MPDPEPITVSDSDSDSNSDSDVDVKSGKGKGKGREKKAEKKWYKVSIIVWEVSEIKVCLPYDFEFVEEID